MFWLMLATLKPIPENRFQNRPILSNAFGRLICITIKFLKISGLSHSFKFCLQLKMIIFVLKVIETATDAGTS